MNQPERRDQTRTSFSQTTTCTLKHLSNGKLFRADIADLSIKGIRLKFPSDNDINIVTDNPANLLILESNIENPKIDLTGRTVIVIWQEGLEMGCGFVD